MSTAISYNHNDGQKLFDRLSDILEEVENVHRYIRYCASKEEVNDIRKNEDNSVVDFCLRFNHQED